MDAGAEGFAQFVEGRQRALQRTAWLLTGGFLVEIAVTVHHGIAFVFTSQSQNPAATTSTDRANDRAAFGKFLAGIRLQR